MSISFGGLASGVDTSAWIEALVSMKQASLKTYETKKEALEFTTGVLENVKSFFASFKGVISRVTDSNLGIASYDLFIQNLVETTNADVVTASVTTQAQQANYEVFVDQVATETQALSNYYTNITTTTESIASHNSLLSSIGIGTGRVGFNVDGSQREIILQSNDTIGTLIEKLNKIGIDAGYDANQGMFSINVDIDDINDIDNTGIKTAFFLIDVNSGYSSDLLELFQSLTSVITATEASVISTFGITDNEYYITSIKDSNTTTPETIITTHTTDINRTFGEFFNELLEFGLVARFNEEGAITIQTLNGNIISGGLAEQLGIVTTDNLQQTETKASSTVGAYSTETLSVDYTSTLGDIGAIINDTDRLQIFDQQNNLIATITTLTQDSTVDDLFATLAQYGITATLQDSVITLESRNGNVVGGVVAENMGIATYHSSTTTIKSGNSTTSTAMVSYVASATDWVSDCLWDVWDSYSAEDKVITVTHTDRYGTDQTHYFTVIEKNSIASDGSVQRGTQFQDIIDWYKSIDPTSTFTFDEDGHIFIDSNDNFYIEGTIMDYLGIGGHTDTYTWTEGITTTTSEDTVSFRVRWTDNISDVLWDNGWLSYSAADRVISAYSLTVDHTTANDSQNHPDGAEGNYVENGGTYQHTIQTLVKTFTIIESQTSVHEDMTVETIVQGSTFEDLAHWYTTEVDTTATFLINNDGTITIDSNNTFHLEGRAVTDLGIGEILSVHQTWTTGTASTQSTASVVYAAKMTDYISDTFTSTQWANVNKTISVYETHVDHQDGGDGNSVVHVTVQTKLTDITIDEGTTFNSLAAQLQPYGITLSMDNGVLTINSSSDATNYLIEESFCNFNTANGVTYITPKSVPGLTSMLDHFGIKIDTVQQTWTTGTASTESTAVVNYYAKMTDYIKDTFTASDWASVNKDIVINHTEYDHVNHRTVISQVTTINVTDTTTFNDLASRLNTYGMTLTLQDGVLVIDSDRVSGLNDSLYYVTGAIPDYYGMKVDSVTEYWTTGTVATESSGIVNYNITLSDYISDTFTQTQWNNLASYTNSAGEQINNGKVISIMHTYLDHDDQHTVIETTTLVTIDTQTTFQDLKNTLANYGITLSIDDGILKLDSDPKATQNRECFYIEGSIPNHYGLRTTSIQQTWTTGTVATQSTQIINYYARMQDYISDTFTESEWASVNKGIVINHTEYDHVNHRTVISAVTTVNITNTMTFQDLYNELHPYGITLDIVDGVLTLDSEVVNATYLSSSTLASHTVMAQLDESYYITGAIPNRYGVTTSTLQVTWTTGTVATESSSIVNYNITLTDYISDTFKLSEWNSLASYTNSAGEQINNGKVISIMHTYLDHDEQHTVIERTTLVTIDTQTTFQDLKNTLSNYGITLSIDDGILKLDSDPKATQNRECFYIEGSIPNHYGLRTTSIQQTWTTGTVATQSTQIVKRKVQYGDYLSDTFTQTDWNNLATNAQRYTDTAGNVHGGREIAVMHSYIDHEHQCTIIETKTVITIDTQTTFQDLKNILANLDMSDNRNNISLTIDDGVLKLDSDCCWIEGKIPDHYGVKVDSVNMIWTTGTTATESTGNVQFNTSLNDFISDTFTADAWSTVNKTLVIKHTELNHDTHAVEGANTVIATIVVNNQTRFYGNDSKIVVNGVTINQNAVATVNGVNNVHGNLKEVLGAYGISLNITNGVLTLDSAPVASNNNAVYYLEDATNNGIMKHYGIKTDTVTQTWTTGTAATESTANVDYAVQLTDYLSDTFTQTAWNNLATSTYTNSAGQTQGGRVISVMHSYLDHNTHQTVIETKTLITIDTQTTFEDLQYKLAHLDTVDNNNNISMTIDNGVLKLDSNCCWIEGLIPDHYGVTTVSKVQTWTYGTDSTSNASSYIARMTDYISDTMSLSTWNSKNKTIIVKETSLNHTTHQTVVNNMATIVVNDQTRFDGNDSKIVVNGVTINQNAVATVNGVNNVHGNLKEVLGAYGITLNINDGVMQLDSDCRWIEGEIPSYYGVTTDQMVQTWTYGTDSTGSASSFKAVMTDYIKDSFTQTAWNSANKTIAVKHTYLDHNTHQTVVENKTTTVITDNTTFNDLASFLSTYGMTMGINANGVLTIDSNEVSTLDGEIYYIEGDIPNHFGVITNNLSQTWIYGTDSTGSASSFNVVATDYIADTMTATKWNGINKTIIVNHTELNHANHTVTTYATATIIVNDNTRISGNDSQIVIASVRANNTVAYTTITTNASGGGVATVNGKTNVHGNLAEVLAAYGVTVSVSNTGVLKFDGDCNYLQTGANDTQVGAIVTHFVGTALTSTTQAWTTGAEATSSSAVVTPRHAVITDYIKDTMTATKWNGINKTIVVSHTGLDHNGHTVTTAATATIVVSDKTRISGTNSTITVNGTAKAWGLKEALAQYGVTVSVSNTGVLKFDGDCNYLQTGANDTQVGAIVTHFVGTALTSTTQTWTYGTNTTGTNVSYTASMTDYISDTMTANTWNNKNKTIIVKDTYFDHSTHQTVVNNMATIIVNDQTRFDGNDSQIVIASVRANNTVAYTTITTNASGSGSVQVNGTYVKGNLKEVLGAYGITLGMNNGAVTLSSDRCWIEGEIPSYFGATSTSITQTWTTGSTETDGGYVFYEAQWDDYLKYIGFLSGEWDHIDKAINIYELQYDYNSHSAQTVLVGTVTATDDMTFGDLSSELDYYYDINLDLYDNGSIMISSTSGRWAEGAILDWWHLDSYTESYQTVTYGVAATSSSVKSAMKLTDRIYSVLHDDWDSLDKVITIHTTTWNMSGTSPSNDTYERTYTVTESTTLQDLQTWLQTGSLGMNISNGVLSLTNATQGYRYVDGDIAYALGMRSQSITVSYTVGDCQTHTGNTVTAYATLDHIISDVVEAIGLNNKNIYVVQQGYDFSTGSRTISTVATIDTVGKTFNQVNNELSSYGFSFSISNDITHRAQLHVSNSDYYLQGQIVDALGLNVIVGDGEYVTFTVGQTYTGNVITATATRNSTLGDYGALQYKGTWTLYKSKLIDGDVALDRVTLKDTTTIGEILDKFNNTTGFSASLNADGSISLSCEGGYFVRSTKTQGHEGQFGGVKGSDLYSTYNYSVNGVTEAKRSDTLQMGVVNQTGTIFEDVTSFDSSTPI